MNGGLFAPILLWRRGDIQGHAGAHLALTGSPVLDEIGRDKLFGNLDDALDHARHVLGLPSERPPAGAEPTVARERTGEFQARTL